MSLFGEDSLRSTDTRLHHASLRLTSSNPKQIISGLWTARALIRRTHPHVVHSHAFHANAFGRLLRCVVPEFGLVSTIHSTREGGRVHQSITRVLFRLSTQTTAVSVAVAEAHIRSHAAPRGSLRIVSNGVDVSEFVPCSSKAADLRQVLGLRAGQRMLLSVGRLTTAKDYPNLLRAFAEIRVQIGDTHLFIAGTGPLRKELDSLRDRLGLAKYVTFLGNRSDVPALLNATDAFILSSEWEGLPMAVAEAMASRTPVISTRAGGAEELLGRHGVLVSPRNDHELARGIHQWSRLGEPALLAMTEAAHQRILEQFDIERIVTTWEAIYASCSRRSVR